MADLAGLTNAVTDIIIRVTDEELEKCGLKKGFRNENFDSGFLSNLLKSEHIAVPGGSPANVIKNASMLGLDTSLFGTVGNDAYGKKYAEYFRKYGVSTFLDVAKGGSGLCYVLVAPDGEKASVVDMGVAGRHRFCNLKQATVFHTSGYELLANENKTLEAIRNAKQLGAAISFDLADPFAVKTKRKAVEELLPEISVLFATQEEAVELTGLKPRQSLEELVRICPLVAMKKGKKGSVVRDAKSQYMIPAYKANVVNTNGAGDAYAAGFLFGFIRGLSPEECGHFGSYLASRVCSMEAPHL